MNDNELIALLRSDSAKGLEAVVRQYSTYVYKIAYTKLNGVCTKEDIEEAVSDVFLMFYNVFQKDGFEVRSVQAVLSVITKRHCINIFHKHRKRVETIDYDELENVISDDKGSDPDLIYAIKKLGEPDSSIFIRKYYLGQRNKDIAKDLGMNTSTLNMKLSRGLKKLKTILEEEM